MANQYDTNLKLQAIADAIGDSQSSGLIQALEDIADAVAGGGGGGSSIAGLVSDNFSETDTYDLGDYCIHNNTLYVCINAITTPGAWDLSDWQATNAGMELSSLNSALQNYLKSLYSGKTIAYKGIAYKSGSSTVVNVLLPEPLGAFSSGGVVSAVAVGVGVLTLTGTQVQDANGFSFTVTNNLNIGQICTVNANLVWT